MLGGVWQSSHGMFATYVWYVNTTCRRIQRVAKRLGKTSLAQALRLLSAVVNLSSKLLASSYSMKRCLCVISHALASVDGFAVVFVCFLLAWDKALDLSPLRSP